MSNTERSIADQEATISQLRLEIAEKAEKIQEERETNESLRVSIIETDSTNDGKLKTMNEQME